MIRFTATAGAVLLALSACSPASARSAADPPVSALVSASASPAGSRVTPLAWPTYPLDQWETWVDAAELAPHAMGTAKPISSHTTADYNIHVCGRNLGAVDDPAYLRYWQWEGSRIGNLEHIVGAYPGISATEVLSDIEGMERSCTPRNESSGNITMRVTQAGRYAMHRPAGIDGEYAYCEMAVEVKSGLPVYFCTGILARGSIVDSVGVFGHTLRDAQRILGPAVDAAATALIHAAPDHG